MRRICDLWFVLVFAILHCGWAFAGFTPPTKEQQTAAIGSLQGLSASLQHAFTNNGEFEAKKSPAPMDWLGSHAEPGQTFTQYLAFRPNLPDATRRKLYILPIGEFTEGIAPDLAKLKEYTAAYYHPLPVEMLPVIADKDVPAACRLNPYTQKKQWKTRDILPWMKNKVPADAFAVLAVTMTDLYPDESWNFVFGEASYKERVGVFSFARYHPSWMNQPTEAATETLVLRRAAKVLTHEMGHMFGIAHCIYFECNMNGANHLAEADATPMHLCPVCLRKLHHAIRFDPVKRYELMQSFYEANRMTPERDWTKARIEAIRAAK